jgi:hypothetical protein
MWSIWPAWVWFTVMATANHYWLDVIMGALVALLGLGLAVRYDNRSHRLQVAQAAV